MKRVILLLALVLLLTGCSRQTAPPPPAEDPPNTETPGGPQPVSEDFPLELDILRIEISRGGLDPDRLMEAARKLPELTRDALASNHVRAGAVQVTIGSSPAATVQALNEGNVDLAILPAEGFAGQETEAAVLLASGPGGEGGQIWDDCSVGFETALWLAPTDYGKNLASRVGKEADLPTWDELDRARWGLLGLDSLQGRQAVDLWLADHYDGRTTASLSRVTVYEDFDRLFEAAEEGEADVFATDGSIIGVGWDGGPAPGSAFRLGMTERFYDMVAVVSPKREDLSDPDLNLKDPLMFTLTQLCFYDGTQTYPDGTPAFSGNGYDRETLALCRDVFGAYRYSWAENEDLDATRRLLTLEGVN